MSFVQQLPGVKQSNDIINKFDPLGSKITQAIGVNTPDMAGAPATPTPPPPPPTYDTAAANVQSQQDQMRQRQGRGSTILTGRSGAAAPQTATTLLLGR